MHAERHQKLLELRNRATRQPISYKPLFDEAVNHAADLLHEALYVESYLVEPTPDMVLAGQLEINNSNCTPKSIFRAMISAMPEGL